MQVQWEQRRKDGCFYSSVDPEMGKNNTANKKEYNLFNIIAKSTLDWINAGSEVCTFSEASGCSGPSKLQWKEARSSSGSM
jgi:hypothetical protein